MSAAMSELDNNSRDLCRLMFDNITAEVELVAKKRVVVLGDLRPAAQAILDAGFCRALAGLSDLDLAEIIAEAISDHNEMGDVAWDRVAQDVRAAIVDAEARS